MKRGIKVLSRRRAGWRHFLHCGERDTLYRKSSGRAGESFVPRRAQAKPESAPQALEETVSINTATADELAQAMNGVG